MSRFSHLHLHTQYSLLDGANKITDVIQKAFTIGQPAIAITDHGNMHGTLDFYNAANKIGIKPIIGCELYVTTGPRSARTPLTQGGKPTFHLTALAMNMRGYTNLCRLVSLSYREGFYHKPRVDHEILAEYNEGIIILSGCLGSELASYTEIDDRSAALHATEFFATTFKDRYFLEVQPHQIREQQKHNIACLDLAMQMGIPLVATTDCHYGCADDHFAQEVLMCISTGKTVADPDRIRHEGVHLHLKDTPEMLAEFPKESIYSEAIEMSGLIADKCNLVFTFNKYYMPRFSEKSEDAHAEQMAEIARKGLTERLNFYKRQSSFTSEQEQQYQESLDRELTLINGMGFASYFLVVSDFIVWAKEHQIPVGPGRGSVAGSLVAFAMRITEVDPILHNLLFERFLNPERISMPDIDVDFCINGREQVIKYVTEKYGKDKVAQIATFGTLKAKAAIKDVGRALGISYAETDRIAQLIPAPRQGFDYPIKEALEMEPKLKEYSQGEGKQLIELAMKLEGLTRHSSTHAAGVVIGDRPLMELLPMMVDKDDHYVTQFSMGNVEKIGLVKFDFLGLKTLTVIETACKIIEESTGGRPNLNEITLEDPASFELLCKGNTVGVFQLESGGITEMTFRLKPNCFEDLVAILALYRPGPLDAGMVDHYIERKHGREPVSYLHPLMEPVLQTTYGIMLYQEQIMQLARVLAGYSLAEADFLRKAMGKKNPEEMAKQKTRFLDGTTKAGISKALAVEIFGQMETFARYGFNRSHSVAYAIVSYQTAYLKAHYGVEFMAALLSHDSDDSDKTLKNLTECRKQSIAVLPPDINESNAGFTVVNQRIRYGLGAIKGIGDKVIQFILSARAKKQYEGIEDFLARVDPKAFNRKALESLIKCGAFDFSNISRRELFESIDEFISLAQSFHRDQANGQRNLFAPRDGSEAKIIRKKLALPEWSLIKKLSFEREALGSYISGHPLERYRKGLARIALSTQDLRARKKGEHVSVAGVVTSLKLKNTKKGDRYASFVLEDELGTVEALVWPDNYKKLAEILSGENPVLCKGKADISEERCTLIIDMITLLESIRNQQSSFAQLRLQEHHATMPKLIKLKRILEAHHGNIPVLVSYPHYESIRKVNLPLLVNPCDELAHMVEELYGEPVLRFS
jgi:DNA polymerase III subunit alpha